MSPLGDVLAQNGNGLGPCSAVRRVQTAPSGRSTRSLEEIGGGRCVSIEKARPAALSQ